MQETADVVASLLAGTPRIARCAAAGGRAKLTTKEKQSTTRGIGRLVWEMDVVDVAVSSLILAPINAWHQASSNITSLGDTHLYQGGSRLAKYFGYSKDDTSQFGVGTDARKLDSSLREWLTNCIFDHFRSGFSDGWDGKYDTLWSFIKQMHVGGKGCTCQVEYSLMFQLVCAPVPPSYQSLSVTIQNSCIEWHLLIVYVRNSALLFMVRHLTYVSICR